MPATDPGPGAAAEILSIEDERYPPLLREIHDPPRQLYALGNIELLQQPQLAVVGSRRASPAGLRLTGQLCAQAVAAGLGICSGLALGIDGAAHRAAVNAGGGTVAVMATGIDQVYPRCHRQLAADVVRAGCLVTEFPPGTPPRASNFPQRNRIISGMSLGVLVVEAALPSGSLITARTALEQGREVFAAPWSVLHKGGEGCLYLLADGARLVRGIEDILGELGPLFQLQLELSAEQGPQEACDPLLALVGFEAVSVDELVRSSGREAPEVMAVLGVLELEGRVVRTAGGYIRC